MTMTDKKKKRPLRVLGGVLLTFFVLIVVLPLTLYIPAVQDFVCRQVVAWLNKTDDALSFEVGYVRIDFPLQLRVGDVSAIRRSDGQILFSLGQLKTGLDDIPLGQPYFVVNEVYLADVVVAMDSITPSFGMVGAVEKVAISQIQVDPFESRVFIDNVVVGAPDFLIFMGPAAPDTTQAEAMPWQLALNQVNLTDGHIGLDLSDVSLRDALSSVSMSQYFDPQHLNLTGVNLHADQIAYRDQHLHLNISELTATEDNCGFGINGLDLDFSMDGTQIAARNLALSLTDGSVEGDVVLDLALLDSLHQGAADVSLKARVGRNSLVALGAGFVPALATAWPKADLTFDVTAHATADSLDMRQLNLAIDKHVSLRGEAFGRQIFDNDARQLAATLKGDLPDARFLVEAFADPTQIQLPQDIALNLEASQRQQYFSAVASLQQEGRDILWVDGQADLGVETYHVSTRVDDLDVADYMPQLGIDRVALQLQADGRHFAFPGKWTSLTADASLEHLYFRDTHGKADSLLDLTLSAELQKGNYVADLQSRHPSVQIDTHLEGIFLPDTVSTSGHVNLPLVDLAHLPAGLSNPTFGKVGLRSKLAASYNFGECASLDLRIDSLTYRDDYADNLFDSILIDFRAVPRSLTAHARGGDAHLDFRSNQSLSELPAVSDSLLTEVNRQVDGMRLDFGAIRQRLPRFDLDFEMARNNPFYPALQYLGYGFQSVDVEVHNDRQLNLDAACYLLMADDLVLDTIEATMRPMASDPSAYDLKLHANHLAPKPRNSYDVSGHVRLMPDSLYTDLCYLDGNYLPLYDAAASLALGDDTLAFHLENDPVLYGLPFTVNKDNFLGLARYRHALTEHNLNSRARIMLQGPRNMSLSLYSRKAPDGEPGQQLLLLLQKVDLNYMSKTIGWDGNTGGTLGVTAVAHLKPASIEGRLLSRVGNFHLGEYKADSLAFNGHFDLNAEQTGVDGTLTIDSLIRVQLNAAMRDSLSLTASVRELPLALVNFFMPPDVALSGTTSGEVTMLGTDIETADLGAYLTLQNAGIAISDLDANLRLPNDTLRLVDRQLRLRNYNITAANRNPISINGLIDMRRQLDNPDIDLRIAANDVRIIDNKRLRLRDQILYGRLPISTDIRVRGTASQMRVNGSLNVLTGTNLNVYLQDDPLQSSSKVDGLVEFVSFRQLDRAIAAGAFKGRAPMVASTDDGVNVDLKVNIDKDVRVKAYLPGTDNNYAQIVGGGQLDVICEPDGSLSMGGAYNVSSGHLNYKLPVLPMAKVFNIKNTSRITWNGPVDKPEIDILATEDVKATVNDDAGSRNVKFEVGVGITGTLEALNLTFACDAPDDGAISSEIATMTPDENSKAAMMLLIAQTYTGPGSSSSMGLSTANAAINSMLNRQMDSMLGSALKYTDIDLGIDMYDTEAGASRTDYSIKVSQRFFNDRFRATIGGQVSSGGDNAGQGSGAQLGDLSLEWLIKKDGTHYLRLYRHTNYQSVLEGRVIETGIGYVQERSAYRFRHLLVPTSRKRTERMMEIIRQLQEKEAEEMRQQRQSQPNDTIRHE